MSVEKPIEDLFPPRKQYRETWEVLESKDPRDDEEKQILYEMCMIPVNASEEEVERQMKRILSAPKADL